MTNGIVESSTECSTSDRLWPDDPIARSADTSMTRWHDLEPLAQFSEVFEFQQLSLGETVVDLLVFEDPGLGVGDEDGVKSGG